MQRWGAAGSGSSVCAQHQFRSAAAGNRRADGRDSDFGKRAAKSADHQTVGTAGTGGGYGHARRTFDVWFAAGRDFECGAERDHHEFGHDGNDFDGGDPGDYSRGLGELFRAGE